MILEAKFIFMAAPVAAAGAVFHPGLIAFPNALRLVLDVAALAILFTGFLILGKLRAEKAAAEGSANAWHEERDAYASKVDRITADLITSREETASLRTLNVELQNRPTLEGLVAQIAELRSAIDEVVRLG